MLQSLTRGVGFLEEAEFNSRRDAEQMARTLGALRDALTKVQSIHEETWTQDNYNVEVTRALTIIDNGRMEWNAARLKWALLNGPQTPEQEVSAAEKSAPRRSTLSVSFSFANRDWPLPGRLRSYP